MIHLVPDDPLFVADNDANPAIQEMETMILQCAKLDREINYFVDIVKQVTTEVRATCTELTRSRMMGRH